MGTRFFVQGCGLLPLRSDVQAVFFITLVSEGMVQVDRVQLRPLGESHVNLATLEVLRSMSVQKSRIACRAWSNGNRAG